jgi:hypothetical protein
MNFSGDTICIRRSRRDWTASCWQTAPATVWRRHLRLPAVDTFFAMCDRNLPVQEIARTINRKLHTILPIGRFVPPP